MKRLFTYILLGTALAIASCKPAPEETKTGESFAEQIRKERIVYAQKMYNEAMKVGDAYSALNSAYSLLVDDTANTLRHLDTIVNLYVKLDLARPALKTADRILALDPDNEKMQDLKTTGELAQGKVEETIQQYKETLAKTNDPKYLFKIALVQVQTGEAKALKETINEFEKHPQLATVMVDVPSGTGLETQKIPGKVALTYLRALEAARAQNYTLAKKLLNEALAQQPDFFMAKQILDGLNQQAQPRRQ